MLQGSNVLLSGIRATSSVKALGKAYVYKEIALENCCEEAKASQKIAVARETIVSQRVLRWLFEANYDWSEETLWPFG